MAFKHNFIIKYAFMAPMKCLSSYKIALDTTLPLKGASNDGVAG